MTSSMALLPYLVDVCLLMAWNIRQPASRQCAEPVIRYMYHTDSMASGLWGRQSENGSVEEGNKDSPEDIMA